MALWPTSRTRYEKGTADCQMARFLGYHYEGVGIRRKGLALPLATGTYLHQALALFLKGMAPKEAVAKATAAYRAEVAERGFADQHDVLFTVSEQCCLIEGLFWGWVLQIYPKIAERFEILDVEREEQVVLGCTCGGPAGDHAQHTRACKGVVLIAKPDFVARDRESHDLTVHDFKTSASFSEATFDQYRASLQFACGILGVEARTGERVQGFYVHAMLKGGRGVFSRGDRLSPQERQYSLLCYAKIAAPNPPVMPKTSWDLKGYWVDKDPVWEAEFSEKPPEMGNSEYWVRALGEVELAKHFMLAGPFNRPDAVIDTCVAGLVGEEHQWIDRLWRLAQNKEPWDSAGFQRALAYEAPPSWNCYSYGSACQFVDICHRRVGWKDPLGSGKYVKREPLHPELEAGGRDEEKG